MSTSASPSPARLSLWRRWEWLTLPLLALPALWLYVENGLTKGHDVPNHLQRLMTLDQYFSAGMFYPRWLPDLALGYGYPLLNFYAPATYYLAWLWKLAVGDYQLAFTLTLSTLMLAGGWGVWALASDIFEADAARFSRWQPLAAAAAYMYAPYLLTNVFVRGAVAELGAQAWLPWILLGFRRVMLSDKPAHAVPLAALALAGLVMTHSISLLLAPPFVVAYVLTLSIGRARRLGWAAAAGGLALGLSAIFWLPLLIERQDLAPGAVDFARQWMADNFWNWDKFLVRGLFFSYSFHAPFSLGLAQVLLAAAGLLARRTRSLEWWFFGAASLALTLLAFDFAQPLWYSVRELVIVQFPWRLLSLMCLPLALLTAGCLVPARGRIGRALAGAALIGVVIAANRPDPAWSLVFPDYRFMPADGGTFSPATVAQYERTVNDLGLSSNANGINSDFIPRWVDLRYGLRTIPAPPEMLPSDAISAMAVEAGSAFGLRLKYTAEAPARLLLTGFFFPGWRARLDGGAELPLYASTPMGLLTLDLPAGTHAVELDWAGTRLQWAASAVSGLALAGLALFLWLRLRQRGRAALAVAALTAGAALIPARPPLMPSVAPPAPASLAGLDLLGLRWQLRGPYLDFYPYWFVRAPVPDMEFWWQLTDDQGRVLSEARTRPYFDTLPAYSWRTGTLVDDAYRIALPAGQPAGDYGLRVCAVLVDAAPDCAEWVVAGRVSLPAAPAATPPAHTALGAHFGGQLELAGYALRRPQTTLAYGPGLVPIVRPGDWLNVTVYWRAERLITENYHGFVHLLGADASKWAEFDHLIGPFFYPPRLWDLIYLKPDTYPLDIAGDVPSGLYQPLVGVYSFADMGRLPAFDAAGASLGDGVSLPPIKVLNPPAAAPQHPLSARLADLAEVIGYDLEPAGVPLQPGAALTVTIYYRALQPAPADYTRFLHLSSAAAGLVAQADSQPQAGRNPTSAWLPGEVVADTVTLTLGPEAPAGDYALSLGLYDLAADGARLPAQDAQGQPLPNNAVILSTLQVAPRK